MESPKYLLIAFLEFILDFFKTLFLVALAAFLIRYFLVQPFIIEGNSMEPSFHDGEYLLTDKLSYRFRLPERGEVIIFHPPENPGVSYIKRIIGLPGDTVEIRGGKVIVNGKILTEPEISGPTETTDVRGLKTVVGPDSYFVLGDNRSHSRDSREIGTIPKVNISGRVWFVVLPIKDFGLVRAVESVL